MEPSQSPPNVFRPASEVTKSDPKKKSSKESSSSLSTEPFIRDTTQLFSLNPMDYDEIIRVMIEFIAHHPISIPLTQFPDPPIPLRLPHKTFDRIKFKNDVRETRITGDHIVPVHKSTFLKAIGIPKNPEGFNFEEPSVEEF